MVEIVGRRWYNVNGIDNKKLSAGYRKEDVEKMISETQYINLINEIKGKTIAVVYIYEKESAHGFAHYDIWKSNLISSWLNAIQELQCIPYIMDVRTFLFKASNNTLPPIDYVINMNAGCINLSTLALVPSICGFIDVECIPCDSSAIIAGENKSFANMIAANLGYNTPKHGNKEYRSIYRPLNYGSSKGVKIIEPHENIDVSNGIFQEFIEGYDITTPLLYNPLTEEFGALPTIFYLPKHNNSSWFFSAEAKETDYGFSRVVLPNISSDLIEQHIELMNKMNIDTYCRIDMRMRTTNVIHQENLDEIELNKENAYFIEVNPMPTIEIGNNFHISFQNINSENDFYNATNIYKSSVKKPSMHGFILSCALIKKFISKH